MDVSLIPEAVSYLQVDGVDGKENVWWTIDEILQNAIEPNVRAIANFILQEHPQLQHSAFTQPSMDALASHSGGSKQGRRPGT